MSDKEHPLDACECGDYRRDHDKNGPCKFNSQNNGGLTHGFEPCLKFKLKNRHTTPEGA